MHSPANYSAHRKYLCPYTISENMRKSDRNILVKNARTYREKVIRKLAQFASFQFTFTHSFKLYWTNSNLQLNSTLLPHR